MIVVPAFIVGFEPPVPAGGFLIFGASSCGGTSTSRGPGDKKNVLIHSVPLPYLGGASQ